VTNTSPPKVSRAAWALAAIALAARFICIVLWPADWYSIDCRNWQIIAGALLVGINPYKGNSLLNWPPMWMEVLFIFAHISDRLGWQFLSCLRSFLTLCDGVLIISTCVLAQRLSPTRKVFAPVLIGICLNPFLILLTIQQGNFDVIPTILILWFLISLIRFRRGGQSVDWLIAALWLGLGAFAKTFPLVLLPMLFAESRRLGWKTRLLGAALCLVPSAISLAPLYALTPRDVTSGVLLYRGTPGTMGVSGILLLTGGRPALIAYAPIFTAILAILLIALTLLLWFRPPRREADLVLLAALMLMAVFIFGPGNSLQYWYWVAPLLVIVYLESDCIFSRIILISAIVVTATALVAFAYTDVLGAIVYKMNSGGLNTHLHDWFNHESNMSRFCLPLTAMSFLLWIFGVRSIITPAKNPPGRQ
jgi:hypothetical protein